MYHIAVDVTNGDVSIGNIAEIDVNPIHLDSSVRREYE